MSIKSYVFIVVSVLPGLAVAQGADYRSLAIALGSVLASEEYCDLVYDQGAISAWINQNVDPAEMGFANTLLGATRIAASQLTDLSQSSRTAHCESVEQTARNYGFIR